ncbi:hypothetical protein BDZ91DRAFT_796034 [Kalaharituber pfeilii]|nr:hypothetical protein BDZ91DRAFT_796034 [Kalaharituber pfeilii]
MHSQNNRHLGKLGVEGLCAGRLPWGEAKELERWQYIVAKTIIGTPWGTRRDVVEGLANLESVQTFVEGESTRVEARSLGFEGEALLKKEEDSVYLKESLRGRDPLTLAVLPSLPPSAEKEEWEREIAEVEAEGWEWIYTQLVSFGEKVGSFGRVVRLAVNYSTDSSRIEEGTGAGYWQLDRTKSVYMGAIATVNDAELMAMAKALEAEEAGQWGTHPDRPAGRERSGSLEAKIGKIDSPECRWCREEEETVSHIWNGCGVWRSMWPGGLEAIYRPPETREGEWS